MLDEATVATVMEYHSEDDDIHVHTSEDPEAAASAALLLMSGAPHKAKRARTVPPLPPPPLPPVPSPPAIANQESFHSPMRPKGPSLYLSTIAHVDEARALPEPRHVPPLSSQLPVSPPHVLNEYATFFEFHVHAQRYPAPAPGMFSTPPLELPPPLSPWGSPAPPQPLRERSLQAIAPAPPFMQRDKESTMPTLSVTHVCRAPPPAPRAAPEPVQVHPAVHATPARDVVQVAAEPSKTQWTAAEDKVITEAVTRFGCRWSIVCPLLPGRTPASVRNRWHRIRRASENAAAGKGANASYRCGRCGQPKRGHVCHAVEESDQDLLHTARMRMEHLSEQLSEKEAQGLVDKPASPALGAIEVPSHPHALPTTFPPPGTLPPPSSEANVGSTSSPHAGKATCFRLATEQTGITVHHSAR
mmetsp:Transcript_24165/g.75321  ORF Transcript_24165/g.75321 Transcript_24165/m.75321 type:complete len:416 (+) Transcript_24165:235-1482(+)